jgi:hypothetical protein
VWFASYDDLCVTILMTVVNPSNVVIDIVKSLRDELVLSLP